MNIERTTMQNLQMEHFAQLLCSHDNIRLRLRFFSRGRIAQMTPSYLFPEDRTKWHRWTNFSLAVLQQEQNQQADPSCVLNREQNGTGGQILCLRFFSRSRIAQMTRFTCVLKRGQTGTDGQILRLRLFSRSRIAQMTRLNCFLKTEQNGTDGQTLRLRFFNRSRINRPTPSCVLKREQNGTGGQILRLWLFSRSRIAQTTRLNCLLKTEQNGTDGQTLRLRFFNRSRIEQTDPPCLFPEDQSCTFFEVVKKNKKKNNFVQMK